MSINHINIRFFFSPQLNIFTNPQIQKIGTRDLGFLTRRDAESAGALEPLLLQNEAGADERARHHGQDQPFSVVRHPRHRLHAPPLLSLLSHF